MAIVGEDRPAISPKAQDALLAIAGGTAVVLGSLMPWMSSTVPTRT